MDNKPLKLWTLDTETRGLFGEVFRVGLYDGSNYYVENDFNNIMKILKKEVKTENHVYIHNLDFDLAKIAPKLFNQDTIHFSNSIFINGSVATLSTNYMTLHDSLKLLPSSLEKLSDDFGLTTTHKMNINDYIVKRGWAVYNIDGSLNEKESKGNFFMNVEPDDEVLNEYLKLDCIALYDIITIVERISKIDLGSLIYAPTTASLAMSVYKTQYSDDFKKATSTKFNGKWGDFLEGFIRCGYYGGRTEVFKPFIEGGYHYDVNSLYPYVMKKEKFPVGIPKYIKGKNALKMFEFWRRRKIGGGFAHCKIIVPDNLYIPPLPFRDVSGKLLFPTGNLESVWSFIEIDYAISLGCEVVEIEQVVYFEKMESIFNNFVTHFEGVKNNSKGAKRTFAKLMMNSLYGKFGMKRERTTFTDYSELTTLEEKEELFIVHRHTNNLLNVSFIEKMFRSKAQYIQPHISAYVTAYARIELLKGLLTQSSIGDVGYCDTDSIACTTKMDEALVHDKEFGKWKLESNIEKAIFLQPKFYSEKLIDGSETIRAKGIPKAEINKINYDTFEKWLKDFKDNKVDRIDIFDGMEARKKFLSTLKNNEDFDKKVYLRKSINLRLEQKRKVDYIENTTSPHKKYCFGDKVDQDLNPNLTFNDKLFTYNDDIDVIKECIDDVGYIQIPCKQSLYFPLYTKLPSKNRRKYFRRKGINIVEWCEATGWIVTELLDELLI